jgi:crotonobetainyl-CoA:carnitine CoA-transferase CaiB-like acyl-CoA transferase
VLIAANSEPLFAKLATLIGRSAWIGALGFDGNGARVENVEEIDAAISTWSRGYDAQDLIELLAKADIPSSKAYDAADCAHDAQYRARGMVREVDDPCFGTVLQAGVVPHFLETPGEVRWAGPDVGAHNAEVLGELLGIDAQELAALHGEGVL